MHIVQVATVKPIPLALFAGTLGYLEKIGSYRYRLRRAHWRHAKGPPVVTCCEGPLRECVDLLREQKVTTLYISADVSYGDVMSELHPTKAYSANDLIIVQRMLVPRCFGSM